MPLSGLSAIPVLVVMTGSPVEALAEGAVEAAEDIVGFVRRAAKLPDAVMQADRETAQKADSAEGELDKGPRPASD